MIYTKEDQDEELIPLKQGLKQQFALCSSLLYYDEELIPLKQGLKQSAGRRGWSACVDEELIPLKQGLKQELLKAAVEV